MSDRTVMSPRRRGGRSLEPLAAALSLVLGFGCAGLPDPVSMTPPKIGEKGRSAEDTADERKYRQVLEQYTDEAQVYAQLDTRAFIGATFQSWEFRDARVRRVVAFQKAPEAVLQERLAKERSELESGHTFFVGIHANESLYDDLDRKSSIWRIVLVTPAGETTPAKIERIGRSTLNLRTLYPYLDEFWTAYAITFPIQTGAGTQVIPSDAKRVTLRMASTLGAADLDFPAR